MKARLIQFTTIAWLFFSSSAVYAQTGLHPHRPSTQPNAWDVVPNRTGVLLRDDNSNPVPYNRKRGWKGAVGFELIKKSVGSGRFFGQAVRLPYAYVDLIGESGEVLNPCELIADKDGVFRFDREEPSRDDDCLVESGVIKYVRLKGSRRDETDFGFKFTHGYTFSPFEATCEGSTWNNPCTGEQRRQLFDNHLNETLKCLRVVAHEDYKKDLPTGCTADNNRKLNVDVVGLLHELVYKRTIVTDAIDEWKQSDELAELLAVQFDRQVQATRETWKNTQNGINYQENLAKAELQETQLAYASAKRCISRCRWYEMGWCVPKCTFGFLVSEIKSKIDFLKSSVATWASISVAWATVGARWSNQIFFTTPATVALWLIRCVGGDLPLVDDFLAALYSTLVLRDRALEMAGQAAQVFIGMSEYYGSPAAPFLILELVSELEDLLNSPNDPNAWETVESLFINQTGAYNQLKAIAAVANIQFGGTLFPRRPAHYVDIPVTGVDVPRGVIHTAVMSPSYSNPNNPSLNDDLPNTLGWIIANWSYRLERARDVLYQPGADDISVFKTKERKDALGVEVVWPTLGCDGNACYIGVDFDSLHFPPPLRTGHDIYIPASSGYNNFLDYGTTSPIVHEYGHFVDNLLTGIDELGLDTSFSMADLGRGHYECSPDGAADGSDNLTPHAGFGEGFASFVALLEGGPSTTTELEFNPMTSETDYTFIKLNDPLRQPGVGTIHLPWAQVIPGIDDDGDGLPNIEEKSVLNSFLSITKPDSDGDSFSDGYEYHFGSNPYKTDSKLNISLQKALDQGYIPANQKGGNIDGLGLDAKQCSDEGPQEEARVTSILWNFVDISSIPERVKKTWYEHPCRMALGSYDCGPGYVCDDTSVTNDLAPSDDDFETHYVRPSDINFRAFPDQDSSKKTYYIDGRGGNANSDTFPTGMCRLRTSADTCSNNFDCPRTQKCVAGQCLQSCVTKLDCKGNETCVSNECTPITSCSDIGIAGTGAQTPDICHSGYYCLDGQCRKPSVPVDAMLRAINHDNAPRLGVGAQADDICEYSEPLFDMVAMHDLQCDPSDTSCAQKVNFTIDNIYAYHTVGKAACGDGALVMSRQSRNHSTFQQVADTIVQTTSEALTNSYSGLDQDRDGKLDGADGCPLDYDPAADYWDLSACDLDQDYIVNSKDNCPQVWNPKQLDCDHDGIGNACDTNYAIRDCSTISVVGSQNGALLDIKLYTDEDLVETESTEVIWENIQLSITEPEDVDDVIELLKEEKNTSFMPCLNGTEYVEQVNQLDPKFDVNGEELVSKRIGHGNGYDLQTSKPPFGSDVPRRYFQVRATWLDQSSGQQMERCSAPIDSSLFNQNNAEFTENRLRNGTIVNLPMHFFYIEDASLDSSVRLYIGHPGRAKVFSVAVDLSPLGQRSGVTGHFFAAKDEVSEQIKGNLYLYGGLKHNGQIARDIWRVPIRDWRYAEAPVLVRDDGQSDELTGLSAFSNGWSIKTDTGILVTGGASNDGSLMRANVIALDDQSVSQVPVAVQFDMRQQYVATAPKTVVGMSQQRDSACIETMLYQVATQCPHQQVNIDSCFDPTDDPCTSDSPSYVAYRYSVDWSHVDCQAVLASCPTVAVPVEVAEASLVSRTYGLSNHTAPTVTYGQSMVVVEGKREVLLFGGESTSGSNVFSDSLHRYSIEKGHYVEVDAANRPPARSWAALVWNDKKQTLYMLGGARAGNKAMFDLWAIEPFVQNPRWQQLSDNGVFGQRSLLNAKILWDSDRDTYMILGGANSIDSMSGQGHYGLALGELLRFKISANEVIPISTCMGEACE